MKNLLFKLAAICFLVCSANAFAASPAPGWIIKGGGNGMVEGFRYDLYNTDQNLYLRYQDRWGVNLGWSGTPQFFVTVQRQVPTGKPITCEEPFALFVEKSWFRWGSQSYGINLTSNALNASMYQWKFTNCGAPGSQVLLNASIGLVNNITSDRVVGCKRLYGVNLCWAKDVIVFNGKNYRIEDVRTLVKYGLVSAQILGLLPAGI